MKLEPLKNKVLYCRVEGKFKPTYTYQPLYFRYFDIKSAVEWLEKRVHTEQGIAVVDWDYVKEAFEDVTKNQKEGE